MPVEDRIKNFKNKGRDLEYMRRRRAECTIELRKQKKEETLSKRRIFSDDEPLSPLQNKQNEIPFEEIVRGIISNDPKLQLTATQNARKTLSRERNPPIDMYISANVIPYFVKFLGSDDSTLQFEAAWALTNIASGTTNQTQKVVESGAVPSFIKLLSSPHQNIAEQSVWGLGNIAGDGAPLRDFVIKQGIIPPLLNLVKPDAPPSFLRNVTWTISNLCRNKNPPPPFEALKECLPTLGLLLNHSDPEIVADSCWALSYLTDGANEKIQEVIQLGVIPRLVELLDAAIAPNVLTPVLRTVGNIVTGDDSQTQCVINAGALPCFRGLLRHSKPSIVKETTWAVSNVCAGNDTQIQAVIDAGLIEYIYDVLTNGDFKSQKEAIWTVTNFTAGGSVQQIVYLVQVDILKPLCDLLSIKDPKLLLVLMDAIANILNAASKLNEADKICTIIEEYGGLDKLENLQQHENVEVYKAALSIIEAYFAAEEDEDNDVAPSAGNNSYAFSVETPPTSGFGF